MLIGKIGFIHEDQRRKIEEYNSEEEDFSIQAFAVFEEIPLGNHYHAQKTEIFIIIKGEGEFVYLPSPFGDKEVCHVEAGSVIKVGPLEPHRFILKPGSKMTCFSSNAFDKEDLIPLKIE